MSHLFTIFFTGNTAMKNFSPLLVKQQPITTPIDVLTTLVSLISPALRITHMKLMIR
jgi:hypothetical protein